MKHHSKHEMSRLYKSSYKTGSPPSGPLFPLPAGVCWVEGVEDNDRNVNPKLSCAEVVDWNPAAKALCQRDFWVSLAELVGSKVKLKQQPERLRV